MIFPMAAMVFYIWLAAIFLFLSRVKAVRENRALAKYFRVYDSSQGAPSERVLRMGQHYDNLLQLPPLFLLTGVVCLHYQLHGPAVVVLGWAFVGSRMLHSIIHLGSNHILKRAGAFALGWAIIIALWILILVQQMAHSMP